MTFDYRRVEHRTALWVLVVGVLSIVTLLVAVGVSSCLQSVRSANEGRITDYVRAENWIPPHQTFLQSSMHVNPVPGWHVSAYDLGLPNGARIATESTPVHSQPLIGNVGERAFFLASSVQPGAVKWWFTGVNVHTGEPLFPAVQLNSADDPSCFLNGADAVLCITSEVENRTAWVIDSHSGTVTYTGPTDLNIRPNDLDVEQVGIYAVAASVDEGIYGVGPRAEPTWFVPGAGDTSPLYLNGLDIDQPPLAYQTVLGSNAFGKTLFSVADGSVVRPEIPDDTEMVGILLYPGGFAAEVKHRDKPGQVMLFDDAGNRSGWRAAGRAYLPPLDSFFDMPYLNLDDSWGYFTPEGGLVLEITEPPVRLVGSRLIVNASESATRGWGQYDIHTGAQGKRCTNLDMDFGYIGYDGSSIAVTSDGNSTIGLDTEATDFNTCERLWTISSPPGSWRNVWRINTTLVQLSDDGTELMSLVAPS